MSPMKFAMTAAIFLSLASATGCGVDGGIMPEGNGFSTVNKDILSAHSSRSLPEGLKVESAEIHHVDEEPLTSSEQTDDVSLSPTGIACATAVFSAYYPTHNHCLAACSLERICLMSPLEVALLGGMLELFSALTGIGVADLQDIIDNTRGMGCGFKLWQSCGDCCR